MLCLLHSFFHLPANFTKQLQSLWVKNRLGLKVLEPNRPHLFLWTCIFCRTLQYVIKSSLHRDENYQWQIWLQSTCISSMTCMQNWELLVFCPWHQRHLGDVKMKCVGKEMQQQSASETKSWLWWPKHHILLRKESSLFKGKQQLNSFAASAIQVSELNRACFCVEDIALVCQT